jgi:amino acid transporter
MNSSQIYLAISIVVLFIVAILFFLISRKRQEATFTPLSGLSFGFIIAGIIFGDDRLIGYGLLGVGVVLAVVDMVRRLMKKQEVEA